MSWYWCVSSRCWCMGGALLAASLLGAAASESQALAATHRNDRLAPVLVSGEETRIGMMRVVMLQDSEPVWSRTRLSVRGSVRLEGGTWCVRTALLPRTSRIRTRSKTVVLDGRRTVLIPRFERTKLGRVVWGDTTIVEAARVTVRWGGCRGPLHARASAWFGGLG